MDQPRELMVTLMTTMCVKCMLPQQCSARAISFMLDYKLVKECHSTDEKVKARNG